MELNPQSKQGDLVCALEPVAERLLRQFKAAHDRWKAAKVAASAGAVEEAHAEMETLMLFKRDMGSFGHARPFFESILARNKALLHVLIAVARKLLQCHMRIFRSGLKYEGTKPFPKKRCPEPAPAEARLFVN